MTTTDDLPRPVITISIYCVIGDDHVDWIVSDDGGEFDDECFDSRDGDAEILADEDAASRAVEYQRQGFAWRKEVL
jgi:anti-sigma regulatory factor (Ser/Thr protein kinase)